MNFPDLIFFAIAAATMAGALVTVLARSVIYALMGLVLTMFGIAGLYIYLNSPFLAMMQILILRGCGYGFLSPLRSCWQAQCTGTPGSGQGQ